MSEREQTIRFQVLGPLRVYTQAGELAIGAVRERTILAMLLLHPGEMISVQRLVDVVWGEVPPQNARNQLQGCVSRLRKQLVSAGVDRQIIATTAHGYQIDVESAELDVLRFRQLRDEARTAATNGDRVSARERYRSALRLWRGAVLGDIDSAAVHRLAVPLTEERAQALEERIEIDLALGSAGELVAELTALTEHFPYREGLHRALMLALYRAGRQADALAAFRHARELLHDELAIEPGGELRRVHQAILNRDPSLDAAPPPAAAVMVPRLLPSDVAGFTGRTEALKALDELLDRRSEPTGPVVISAIAGTAGVGKTALAIHWGHRIADRFPDGQLFVNLCGFDPARSPVEPAEVIRGFLDVLQVPPHRMPASADAQSAMYRSLLASRRMLVVLDNARDAAQVRPLLPGAPGCFVVVTSRNQLSGLIARDGARPLRLDVLTPAEARLLLERRLGAEIVAAEPEAVEEIITRCARLPLALAVAAARAASHATFPLASLAANLREAQSGLDLLGDQDPASDVRAALNVSYRALAPEAVRMFRLLGLHPGPDLSASAAASIAGLESRPARALLEELTSAHLVHEHSPDRFTFHDLLRSYAAELVCLEESADVQRTASQRMLDYYIHSAHRAAVSLNPFRRPLQLDSLHPKVVPEDISDRAMAMSWLMREHGVLLAMVAWAVAAGLDTQVFQLAWTLSDFHRSAGSWYHWVNIQETALNAARTIGDSRALAVAHGNLGQAHMYLGSYDEARAQNKRALDHFIRLGDRAGQAKTYLSLSMLHSKQGHHKEALPENQRAYVLFSALDDVVGQAWAVSNAGWLHGRLGDYELALEKCGQALAMQEQVGDRRGLAATLEGLGYAHQHLGHQPRAAGYYERAIDLLREEGELHAEATLLIRLGDTHSAAGDAWAAREAWLRALAILQEIDHPDANEVQARLERSTVGA